MNGPFPLKLVKLYNKNNRLMLILGGFGGMLAAGEQP